MNQQLIFTSKPQGHRDAVGVTFRRHQLERLEQRPRLFLGHTFGMHGVDVFLLHAGGVAQVLKGMKEAIRQMLPPEVAGEFDMSPVAMPGPIFVRALPGPYPHVLYMTTIIPDSKLPLYDGNALIAHITPANLAAARAMKPIDLAIILAGSNDYAEQIFRASLNIPNSAIVERTWARDFIPDAPAGEPESPGPRRTYSFPSYARATTPGVN